MATYQQHIVPINENVVRRTLLRMDTKTLIKQCKSQHIAYYGSRGEIVNRLIGRSTKKKRWRTKPRKKTKAKKKKSSIRARITPFMNIHQSSTKAIDREPANIATISRRKHKKKLSKTKKTKTKKNKFVPHKQQKKKPIYTTKKAKMISHSQLKLIINGYIRLIMHNYKCLHFNIPDQINNICVNYSYLDIYDLNRLDFNVVFNADITRQVNKIYIKQCQYTLGTMESFEDMKIFTFGIYNNFPQFLQYLSDCYIKKMAQQRKNPFDEESIIIYLKSLKWMKNVIALKPNLFAHFVHNLTYYIHAKTNKNDLYSSNKTYGMRTSAMRIDAYFNRNIYDDIYAIFYYISTAFKFVNHLVAENKNTPFQFDFCVLFKQLKQVRKAYTTNLYRNTNHLYTNDEYDSNDSSDNSDIEYDYHSLTPRFQRQKTPKSKLLMDVIGDVKHRLTATNCPFVQTNINSNFNKQNDDTFERELLSHFNSTHNTFMKKIGLSYLRNRRFIGVVDRRKWVQNEERMDEYDEFVMFEPPKSQKCNELEMDSENAFYDKPLPELYHNKSMQCLLPGVGFNECGNEGMKGNDEELTGDVQETIGCISKSNGAMMTLSFHIESQDQIKCYLWYGSGHLRFYPNDVQNILSLAFMLDYQSNAYFLHDSFIKQKAKQLELKDARFEHFYQTMTNKRFKYFL